MKRPMGASAYMPPVEQGPGQRGLQRCVRRWRKMTGVTDLDRIRGPRDAAVVQLLSRRVEPAFGFFVYGGVYLFLSSFAGLAGGLVGGLLTAGLGFKGTTFQDV